VKITRKQLRQIIQEEARSLNEYERANNLHETSESYTEYSNLSPQKKREWQSLEAALEPFGYESGGVTASRGWPFAIFNFSHRPTDLSGLSTEELGQHIDASHANPGHSLEIRIPKEWYEKGEE